MASVAGRLLISMGLDASQLQRGLDKSKQEIKATGQAIDQMGAKWKATASMLTRTVVAPIAGFLSLGAVIKSYFSGVSQVARLTGAYSQKMEEWRKKRAMLARYNREDIELYKKGREAVVKFQITMDDLSAKIMRSVSPAIKWLIDRLNDFSNWIDRNQNNIIRFFTVVAGVITTILIPTFYRLATAMLANPLTWIIGLLGILILIIDDLVTYLRGGESALGAFWKPLIEYTKTAWEWLKNLYDAFINSTAFKAFSASFMSILRHLTNGLTQLWQLCETVFNAIMTGGEDLNGLVAVVVGIFNTIGGAVEALVGVLELLFGGLIAVFTGDTEAFKNAWIVVCDGLTTASKGAFKVIDGIFTSIKNLFNEVLDVIDSMIGAIVDFGKAIVNALNIDGLIAKVKKGLSNILPDWVKSSLGIGEESSEQGAPTNYKGTENADNSAPTIYENTDAPIVPDVDSMRNMQAQSKGNGTNNNISREQNFYINTTNPAVASATVSSATQEMTAEDRAIAMASQGSLW